MYDVIALGELLIDFASKSVDTAGYPTMAAHPGGAPANFLAALSKFGASTALLGKVGDDAFGHLLLGTLTEAGIETKGIVVDPTVFTTLAFVTFDDKGDRSFSFARKPGADTQLTWEEVDKTMIIGHSTTTLNDHEGITMTLAVPEDMFPSVSTYIRQGRILVNGANLANNTYFYTGLFDPTSIKDPSR